MAAVINCSGRPWTREGARLAPRSGPDAQGGGERQL